MPRGDGTGPPSGSGPGTGRGMGRGRGMGLTPSGQTSPSGGTMAGLGPGGNCVCPACGSTVAHKAGAPCTEVTCPKCGAKMVRG